MHPRTRPLLAWPPILAPQKMAKNEETSRKIHCSPLPPFWSVAPPFCEVCRLNVDRHNVDEKKLNFFFQKCSKLHETSHVCKTLKRLLQDWWTQVLFGLGFTNPKKKYPASGCFLMSLLQKVPRRKIWPTKHHHVNYCRRTGVGGVRRKTKLWCITNISFQIF